MRKKFKRNFFYPFINNLVTKFQHKIAKNLLSLQSDVQLPIFQSEYIIGDKVGQGAHSSIHKCINKENEKLYCAKVVEIYDAELQKYVKNI